MIKQITNLNGVSIDVNKIVDGSSNRYRNERINEIKTGQTLLYKFYGISFSKIKKVANATLLVPCTGNGTFEIAIFRNTNSYVSSLVHGNNEPSYDTSAHVHYEKFTIGKSAGHPEGKLLEIDLTNLFNRWQSESADNMSFTLRCTSTSILTVFGFNEPSLIGETLFTLSYAETDSFSQSFDYLTAELAFGGTAFVNTLTGKLAHQFDVFQTRSKKAPIKFSINYIERLNEVTMKNSLIGNWRTNFDYGFKVESSTITVVSPEGGIAFFEKVSRQDAADKYGIYEIGKDYCFINQMDNSYIVEGDVVSSFRRYKMYDSKKNVLTFNSNNNIINIKKENGATIDFIYDNWSSTNKLVRVASSDGYKVQLTYSGSRIEYIYFIKENRRIFIQYGINGVASITLQKGTSGSLYIDVPLTFETLMKTSFQHSGSILTRVTNDTNKKGLIFTYSNNKVTKITDTSGPSSIMGSYSELNYQPTYTKISDFEGSVEYITHDSYGMLQQRIDNEGNSVSLKHKSVGIDGVARRVSNDSGLIPVAKNRLVDSSFEILGVEGIALYSSGWQTDNKAAVTTSEDGVYGRHALSIKKTSDESALVLQTTFPSKGLYALEFFVKTKSLIGSAKVVARVGVEKQDQAGEVNYSFTDFESTPITSVHSKWTKITIPNILVNDDYGDDGGVYILIYGTHTGGELLVDDIRFTGETRAVNGNVLLDADMESQHDAPRDFKKINCGNNDIIISESEGLPYSKIVGNKRFRFDRAQGITKKLEREIPLYGASGEELTFAFWGKSQFNNGSSLRGKVELKKGGAVVQTEIVEAGKTLIDWQLISVSLTTKRPYDSAKLIIEYTGINQAFIDSICLFRDNFGTHYNYNEKGNLLEEAENASSINFKTDDSKIVESNDQYGDRYQYQYDSNGKVTKIIDAKKNEVTLSYDERGNQIKSRATSNNKTFELSNTYNEDDLIDTATDEFGNTTKYHYESAKRVWQTVEANGLLTLNTYDDLNNLVARLKGGQISTSMIIMKIIH